jgi:hemolysin activation/secretion protein
LKKILIYILVVFLPIGLKSQSIKLFILQHNENSQAIENDFLNSKNFPTLEAVQNHLNKIQQYYLQKGYLLNHFEEIRSDSVSFHCLFILGEKYNWLMLQQGNVSDVVWRRNHFNQLAKKEVSIDKLDKLMQSILDYEQNIGYPFAEIKLDSFLLSNNQVSATLSLKKNELITVDSIQLIGNAKINPYYIYNYISIKPGDLYSEKLILDVSNKISQLPFVSIKQPQEVYFSKEYTKLKIYLQHKKASRFDGVLGLQPDNVTGKMVITGDVKLALQNALGRGEGIKLNWRKLQNNTTDILAKFNYPFLFNTPMGIETDFFLYRRDTSFQEIKSKIGVQYILPGINFFKVFLEKKESRLLSTKGITNTNVSLSRLDVSRTTYGFGLKKEQLDYKFNPRKGYFVEGEAGVGNRKLIKNPELPEVIYNNFKENTLHFSGNVMADFFLPVFKQTTLYLGLKGATMVSNDIFSNELFRIGGLKTIRGFDEESINASTFLISNLEYRYLLEQNSYLHLFFDAAFVEQKTINDYVKDYPFGFGAGLTFDTKAGIFSLSYGLGYQQNQLSKLNASKIHFGFVNFF